MNYNLRIHAFVVLRYLYSIRNSAPDERTAINIYDAIKNHPAVQFKSHHSVNAALLVLAHVGLAESVDGSTERKFGREPKLWSITAEGKRLIEDVQEFESPN